MSMAHPGGAHRHTQPPWSPDGCLQSCSRPQSPSTNLRGHTKSTGARGALLPPSAGSQKGVVNSQPRLKVDTFEKVVCTERSQAGDSNCATLTKKCTQEGFFPSQKRRSGTRICAPIGLPGSQHCETSHRSHSSNSSAARVPPAVYPLISNLPRGRS